jgi:hypothetical protein
MFSIVSLSNILNVGSLLEAIIHSVTSVCLQVCLSFMGKIKFLANIL